MTSSEQVREEIARVLGKDRLHELDKPVFGGLQLSDNQIEEIADALTTVFGSQDADASEGGDRR